MFSVPHIVIIFIVVLVVFGPHKLPELARGLGKLLAEFRKASTDFKMAFEEEMRTIERQAREADWKKSQEAAAAASAGEAQPATLGSPAGAETAQALPESVEVPEPTIVPVSEALSREAHDEVSNHSQVIDVSSTTSSTDGAERETEATTATVPDRIAHDLTLHDVNGNSLTEDAEHSGDSPAHDRRKSA
jgi:TatA/E family protein of Tat protein translocase